MEKNSLTCVRGAEGSCQKISKERKKKDVKKNERKKKEGNRPIFIKRGTNYCYSVDSK